MNQMKTFDNYRVFKTMFAGRELVVETGKTCELSNGSCWVRYGETVVMANVTASVKPREGVDFFPLSVDYEERLYSVGRIPGSFMKREGKPSEKAICQILVDEGYIKGMQVKNDTVQGTIVVTLKYQANGEPVIAGLRRVSKPGLRIYTNCEDMPKVMKGIGIAILSTSKGVMTDKDARKANVGGEVLAFIW